MLREINTGLDILNLNKGDRISLRNLYDVIINSKQKDSANYLEGYSIGNTPQQGINWIGERDNLKAVIIKSSPGNYNNDNAYEYAFKAQNELIDKKEFANKVLIEQPNYNYPILYFKKYKSAGYYELQEFFGVAEVREKSVILKPWKGILTDSDISQIESDDSITGEEKETIIKQRINQGKIRKRALQKYDNKCVLCGLSFTPSLIASHIKSWKESTKEERGDINNILILCANHDSVFDKHYISFGKDGTIIISDKLSEDDKQKLNINESMKLQINVPKGMEQYLEYNRNKLQ